MTDERGMFKNSPPQTNFTGSYEKMSVTVEKGTDMFMETRESNIKSGFNRNT